jgi:selenocysteine-specific elongation factor
VHVIATAGHVDHGKSTLIRALTGMDPDRLAEEHRRQLTIELGFAWTTLPDVGQVAFVDVPGHERFVTTTLAGVGPVPAVLFVVAADEGWMAQSEEHLDALAALGVSHGVLVVTRCDLADPGPATEQARNRLATTPLRGIPAVTVSGVTGARMDDLRRAIAALVSGLPAPDLSAPVRLWLDRSFTIRGAGTVVTGTLAAGTISLGDTLASDTGRVVHVRGIETLGEPRDRVDAVARVALNLRGVKTREVPHGTALSTPQAWTMTDTVDVALQRPSGYTKPARLMLHVGTTAVPCRVRPLGERHARLQLERPLPLHFGDHALLRDPGQHRIVAGIAVLDLQPPPLDQRGDARAHGEQLEELTDAVRMSAHLVRQQPRRRTELARMGLAPAGELVAGDWLVDADRWAALASELARVVAEWQQAHPLAAGMPLDVARQQLGLPDSALAAALAGPAGVTVTAGRLAKEGGRKLPSDVDAAVAELEEELHAHPFQAPDAHRLTDLGLGPAQLAAADQAGRLLRIADGVVLLPDSERQAHEILRRLPQPFTLSEARQALDTTRRIALPLLELMAAHRLTRRTPDGRHQVVRPR